nr:diphosphomevalonate decarboxylase [Pardosa pseudoannulata]
MTIHRCTAEAPVNIAVIKYWGKRNEDLILPVNDSISITLSKDKMRSKTTVACSEKFESNRMWLNGKEEDFYNVRLQNCIQEMKQLAKHQECVKWKLHICSENNFPTAAGLASSAAGFACLVKALAELYGVKEELSIIARQGSGSACRSIYGGFVHWRAGSQEDGSDSFAVQIAPKNHWPEMRVIILVVNASAKEVASTKGMRNSVLTSSLLQHRISSVVPKRVEEISKAILNRDFQAFSEITMKESNQFHAICLDTYPPIHYLNSTSYRIIQLVHAYNDFYKKNKIAYTFDAGPNACLYLLEKEVPEVMSMLKTVFPPVNNDAPYIRGLEVPSCDLSQTLMDSICLKPSPGALQYIINTRVGNGPIVLKEANCHLLDSDGLPL